MFFFIYKFTYQARLFGEDLSHCCSIISGRCSNKVLGRNTNGNPSPEEHLGYKLGEGVGCLIVFVIIIVIIIVIVLSSSTAVSWTCALVKLNTVSGDTTENLLEVTLQINTHCWDTNIENVLKICNLHCFMLSRIITFLNIQKK